MGDGSTPPKPDSDVAPSQIDLDGLVDGGAPISEGGQLLCWDVGLAQVTPLVSSASVGGAVTGIPQQAEIAVSLSKGLLGYVTGSGAQEILRALERNPGGQLEGEILLTQGGTCRVRLCIY